MNKKLIPAFLNHLSVADPVLFEMAQKFQLEDILQLSASDNYFERLCRSIVGQQLSVKAAATIWGRFVEMVGNVDPAVVVALEHQQMREAGLSNAKAKYVLGIAEAVQSKTLVLDKLPEMSDQEVIAELTKLKGVGVWTAEMFLMFTLGREDLFSVGDLGLRRAIERLYNLDNPSTEKLLEISQKWSPFRTYACRVLWESLDNSPKL